jgi:hypothetical protein
VETIEGKVGFLQQSSVILTKPIVNPFQDLVPIRIFVSLRSDEWQPGGATILRG